MIQNPFHERLAREWRHGHSARAGARRSRSAHESHLQIGVVGPSQAQGSLIARNEKPAQRLVELET
jgi:hypothetical protein